MKIGNGKFCPLVGGDCKQLECNWFIQLRGKHPQTGEPLDEWDCAVKWLPLLLIEGAQETRQTAAAIESFRNEMVRQNAELLEHASKEVIEHGENNHHRR
jgi:hypothetical protein